MSTTPQPQKWIGFKGLDDHHRQATQADQVMISGTDPKWRVIGKKAGYFACLVVTFKRVDGTSGSVICAAHDVVGFPSVEQANVWIAGRSTQAPLFFAPAPWPDVPPAYQDHDLWEAPVPPDRP